MQNLHTLWLKGSYQFQCHLVTRASKYGAVLIFASYAHTKSEQMLVNRF